MGHQWRRISRCGRDAGYGSGSRGRSRSSTGRCVSSSEGWRRRRRRRRRRHRGECFVSFPAACVFLSRRLPRKQTNRVDFLSLSCFLLRTCLAAAFFVCCFFQGLAARGAGPSAQAPAQSSEWDERHSAEHNRKYWVNRTTGKSTWHDPNREAQTTRARQPTGGARQSQATRARQPTGGARPAQQSAWVERYSDQHQRKFWTNRSTGESTWNDPTTTTQNPAHAGELEV